MDKDTLKATKGSIKKWKDIAKGKGEDRGSGNCPLCIYFSDDCERCPVGDKVGMSGCEGTPYEEWTDHHWGCHAGESYHAHCPECKEIALKEVAFLEGLLPSADKQTKE